MLSKKAKDKIIELINTMREAIQYLDEKISDIKSDDNYYLFFDIITAFSRIEKEIYQEKNENIISVEIDNFKKSLEIISSYYEEQKYNEIMSFYKFVFIPSFDVLYKKIYEIYSIQM